jgi:hypothetical protein
VAAAASAVDPALVLVLVRQDSVRRIVAEAVEFPHPEIVRDEQDEGHEQNGVDNVADQAGKKSDGPDDDQNDGDGGEHEVFEAAVKFEQDGMFCACRAKARTPRSAPKMEPCFASFPL